MRTTLLATGFLALALAGCEKKPDPAAAVSDAPAATAPAGSVAPSNPNAPAVDGAASITSPANAVAGAEVKVAWTGPGNASDYIDIVPRGATATTGEIAYAYVKDSKGTVTLRAPTAAGEYDVRYVLDMSGARSVKTAAPLTVTAGGATLKAPATADAGQEFTVEWTGPNGAGDYIDLMKAGSTATSGEITYAYTSAGSPAKMEAPSAAGDYDIRYLLEGPGGRKIVATSAIKVSTPKATLVAPDKATKGLAFKVDWTGPRSSGDYVDLVPKGYTATSGEKDYFYVAQGNTGDLTAPEAGEWVIRYVLEAPGGRAVLTSRPVSVR
jgi:Ca-activated chloride channel homolog